MKIHVVRQGESVYSISKIYNVSPKKIITDNEIKSPFQLVIGQSLVIIDKERNPNLRTIEVNGYALPNINMQVLRKTLPNLTYLSIFSYQVKEDGNLISIPDEPLINAARSFGTAPIMVITNIKEGGSFSGSIANKILTNKIIQDNFIKNIVSTLKQKNYSGLDIDFEYLFPSDRENYNNLLRRIVLVLRPMGYIVTSALAPKTSATQQGILYEAHDYPVHGALLNHVILMTYEWGYTYSEPKAVAPINEVRKVIRYAVSAIPRRKILMGIPTYGYDWTLPHKKGTAATALSYNGAIELAKRVGARIRYNYISQSPFFNYFDKNGREHQVWFEDARSIYAKLLLTREFSLGGVSYWTIQKYFPQNWLVLNSFYNIKKIL
jgi:spore germination protein